MRIIAAIALLLGIACAPVRLQVNSPVTYRECIMACETLTLKPDHTFVYNLDGDLWNDLSTTGKWSQDGEYLVLESDQTPCAPGLSESRRDGLTGGIEVSVVRADGGPVVEASVEAGTPYQSVLVRQTLDEELFVPLVAPTWIEVSSWSLGTCRYDVHDRSANVFRAVVTEGDMAPKNGRFLLTDKSIIAVGQELKRADK